MPPYPRMPPCSSTVFFSLLCQKAQISSTRRCWQVRFCRWVSWEASQACPRSIRSLIAVLTLVLVMPAVARGNPPLYKRRYNLDVPR